MRNKGAKSLKLLVALFLTITVILPLTTLLLNIKVADIHDIVSSPQFWPMVANSLVATITATIISVSLAMVLAWCMNRTKMRYRSIFSVLFTLPMLIPSISHGMGLVLLFGDNGLLTNLLGINIHLYGMVGIVIGSILYSFPVAFLMLTDIFRYEDYTTYEASSVLGLNKFQQFMTITLPNMKKPLISVIFATFTMIFTDYGVPLAVGGKMMTLPVYMYREVIGLLDFSKGAIIGVLLLIPAVIAFILDLKNEDGGNASTVTKEYIIKKNKKRDIFSYIFCITTVILVSLPILAFIYLSVVKQYPIDMSFSFINIQKAFELGVGMHLISSLAIAMLTALIGICITYFTAYLTARSKKTFSNMTLHLISMVSLAIPGVVLGLSYVLFFKGSILYGTIMMLVLVNIIHFFASPYLLAYNSLSKFNENLEDVSATLGISKMRMLFDVYIPCTKETMIEIFSYMFVNAMVTISAVSFLANFKNMPLALLIPQFDSQSLIEATAFISIIILVINSLMKAFIFILKRNIRKQEVL
ncbi:MAG: ABC transporter permease subunit [Erysipelotrichaceae bacterium]